MDIDESYLTYYAGPKSDHFNGETFFNPWAARPDKGFFDVLKWRMQGTRAEWPEVVTNPVRPPPPERSDKLRVTYIGHATMLAQIANINILIDPVFSERCSPFSHIGPKRVRPPSIPLEKLPKIDFVFVSHNHYDHMDLPSLSWLARNRKPVFYTPLGNTRLILPCAEKCTVTALDWYQTVKLGDGLNLTLTPSQHWSRRGFNDTSHDLWGGFFLKREGGESLYFTGDSGFYQGLFEDILKKCGTPDIALVPIGAYEPRWFMKYSHMNPEEALMVHKTLKAKKAMAFHFETFQLTDEAIDAPRKAIEALRPKHDITDADFVVPYPGDYVEL